MGSPQLRDPESPNLEQIAEELLSRAGAGSAPNAIELVRAAGLKPRAGAVPRAEVTPDGALLYRGDAEHLDRQRWISTALAGWLLREASLGDTRDSRATLAGAFMLPRESFARKVEEDGWNLREMRKDYPHTSMGTMAFRLGQVHGAVVTLFHQRRLRWRWVSAEHRGPLGQPTRFEQHLADIALESDTTLNPEERVWAFPLNYQVASILLACDPDCLLEKL